MGKKNKKARAASATAEPEAAMPRHLRREVLEIVNVLLDKCSSQFGVRGQEWNEYLEVYELVEKLRKKQANYVMPHKPREAQFLQFVKWLNDGHVDTSAISIDRFDVGGCGLKAMKDIEMSELFLSIPRSVMMTSETAKASVLGPLMQEDRILQAMPNVVLALHVLCEKSSPDSHWHPFLQILPHTYNTPLYFSPEDLQHLKGSPALADALNQFRNITRQYAYFFKLFQGHAETNKLPIKNFCFDDYRWAVSTVMTRQNQIPTSDGDQMQTALIPLWDMCNHSNGQFTTDFSLERDCSECYALVNFNKGDQVFIFYGSRSNAELLVHNGFVYENNEYDRLAVKLGVSKNDSLYSMKAEVLARLAMLPSRIFSLHTGPEPVDSDMLAYLRVFCMDQDELQERLSSENSKKHLGQLRDFDIPVDVANEKRVWSFLETRSQLLLKSYPTSLQEDDDVLANGKLSEHGQLAVHLRMCEKRILQNTTRYCQTSCDNVEAVVAQYQQEQQQQQLASVQHLDDDDDEENEDIDSMVSVSWQTNKAQPPPHTSSAQSSSSPPAAAEPKGVVITEISDAEADELARELDVDNDKGSEQAATGQPQSNSPAKNIDDTEQHCPSHQANGSDTQLCQTDGPDAEIPATECTTTTNSASSSSSGSTVATDITTISSGSDDKLEEQIQNIELVDVK